MMWESEKLFHSGDQFFSELETELEAAQKSIDVEIYIFNNDILGHRIARCLREAARRGVKVRVLVDGIGSSGWSYYFMPSLEEANIECKVYHPTLYDFFYLWHPDRPFYYKLFEIFGKLNQRNHRKVFLIDGKIAWAGSLNIDAHHLETVFGKDAWRDTGIRVTGDEVGKFGHAFTLAWSPWKKIFRPIKRRGKTNLTNSMVRLNLSGRRRRIFFRDLRHRIKVAQKIVWITNAYFVPTMSYIRSLRLAAKAGVDVRLLISRKTDVPFIRHMSLTLYYPLLEAGVKIYEYLPTVLHAKVNIIDDWATVGSSNINHRSFIHDLEVDVVVTKEENKKILKDQFTNDLKNAQAITMHDWLQRPIFYRILDRLFLILRYWF